MVPKAAPQSYHGRPILKAPVWTWEVPGYLFTGGLAGAAAPLAAAARLSGNDALAWRASAAGARWRGGLGAAADLRPRPPRALLPDAPRLQADARR